MTSVKTLSRPVCHCLKQYHRPRKPVVNFFPGRDITTSAVRRDEVQVQAAPTTHQLDPNLVSKPRDERRLLRAGIQPIGSRRRRAALRITPNIPFEQLPYQCFQEARKILAVDREEKLQQIKTQRERIARLQSQDAAVSGGEMGKQRRLQSMERYLEQLKILVDSNDPLVKKRFEDGLGDMSKPIYRHLADRQWREYRRLLLIQRVTQMNVVPDVLPALDPVVDVTLAFGKRPGAPGAFVDSRVSEAPPRMKIQAFDKGERLVSVAVMDSDVPNPDKDGFDYRCHFLASNIAISPVSAMVALSKLDPESQMVLPWLPPFAQKGSPYHRLSVFVMQQREGMTIDITRAKEWFERDGFKLRKFMDKFRLQPVGVTMFRSIWDEGTAGVMQRAGIEGADVEFKRKRVEPLPYKKKDGARYR